MNDISLTAGEFEALCLQLLDQVAPAGESISVTKGMAGPVLVAANRGLYGALAGSSAQCTDDLLTPLGTPCWRCPAYGLRQWQPRCAWTARVCQMNYPATLPTASSGLWPPGAFGAAGGCG